MASRRVRRPGRALLTGLVPLVVASLALSACGSNDGDSGSPAPGGSGSGAPTQTQAADLAAMVPADIKADGKIVIATDASYAPNEFFDTDNKTIIGMDVDLGNAIAEKLGLKAEFQNASFDGILLGLTSGKHELGMSSFTDNAEREQQVDMVSYFSAGTSLATKAGNPDKLDPKDLCGKTIAVQKGTVQETEDITARNEECKAAGKPEVKASSFQLQTDVTLAVASGRAQGMIADSPVVAYAVKQANGKLEVVGEPYDTAPYGIAVPKNKGDFAKAIQAAVQALMDSGDYKKILDKWGVSDGAIDKAEINSQTK